jgi:oligopeptide transport system permease protein
MGYVMRVSDTSPKYKLSTQLALGWLIFLTVAALIGPWALPHDHETIFWEAIHSAPDWSQGFFLGTDNLGRDLAARLILGAQISIAVAACASLVSITIGVIYGAVSGYLGGRADAILMRIVDTLYALPFVILVAVLSVIFGRSFVVILLAIGVTGWLDMARLVRGQTLSLKKLNFVQSAIIYGATPWYIIRYHIMSNIKRPVLVYLLLGLPRAIVLESFLSFLGLGIQEPMTSWGVLITEGATQLETAPWMLLFPGFCLCATLVSLNLLADHLQQTPGQHATIR